MVTPRDPLDVRLTECSYWDRGDYRAALATAGRVLLPKVASGSAASSGEFVWPVVRYRQARYALAFTSKKHMREARVQDIPMTEVAVDEVLAKFPTAQHGLMVNPFSLTEGLLPPRGGAEHHPYRFEEVGSVNPATGAMVPLLTQIERWLPLIVNGWDENELVREQQCVECGRAQYEPTLLRQSTTRARHALVILRGVCPACGETFDVSAISLHLDGSMRHNPQAADETSMVVDAGGWLWIADQYLEWAHERAFKHAARERRRHDLRVAAQALAEALEFSRGGRLPDTAFYTGVGRAYRRQFPGRLDVRKIAAAYASAMAGRPSFIDRHAEDVPELLDLANDTIDNIIQSR